MALLSRDYLAGGRPKARAAPLMRSESGPPPLAMGQMTCPAACSPSRWSQASPVSSPRAQAPDLGLLLLQVRLSCLALNSCPIQPWHPPQHPPRLLPPQPPRLRVSPIALLCGSQGSLFCTSINIGCAGPAVQYASPIIVLTTPSWQFWKSPAFMVVMVSGIHALVAFPDLSCAQCGIGLTLFGGLLLFGWSMYHGGGKVDQDHAYSRVQTGGDDLISKRVRDID
jgi:hypothetical protein